MSVKKVITVTICNKTHRASFFIQSFMAQYLYPSNFKMRVSARIKQALGKTN